MKQKLIYEDVIKTVIEPDYSRGILLEFQKKYCMHTEQFLEYYIEGIPLPVDARDIDKWLFRYRIFTIANGDLNELINSYYLDMLNNIQLSDDSSQDKPMTQFNGNFKEEANIASSFICFVHVWL